MGVPVSPYSFLGTCSFSGQRDTVQVMIISSSGSSRPRGAFTLIIIIGVLFFFPFPKYPLNPGYERIYKSQWRISSNPDKPMAFQPPYLCQWRETSGVKNGINYHFCVFHFFKLKYGWFTMFVNSCCTAKWFGYTYIYMYCLRGNGVNSYIEFSSPLSTVLQPMLLVWF